MSATRGLSLLLAAASCWPVWEGLRALSERDYVATALALSLAWLLARTGLELMPLATSGDGGHVTETEPGAERRDR